jgi:GNAT superfamily N-acetyltransferase
MSDQYKSKLVLFTDANSKKIGEYIKLARSAYNDFPVPKEFARKIRSGLEKTKKSAAEAKKKQISVEKYLKQKKLSVAPVTYALIGEKEREILGVGSMINHAYLIKRAKQANDKALVRDMEAHADSWGCLEYICINKKFRGRKLGRKLVDNLFKKAKEMGLKNVALFCAENEFGFYKKAGMKIACKVNDDGGACALMAKRFH